MNVRQIEYILAVAETGSFDKAAEKCHVAQPTLSMMIKKFEEGIGIVLFDRKTKPVSITEEGWAIIAQLNKIHVEIENLKNLAGELRNEISGKIDLAIIPTVAPFLLPIILRKLLKQLPSIHFNISELTTTKIIERLLARQIDIGIVSLPVNTPQIVEYPLYEEPFVILDYSGEYAGRESISIQDVNRNKLWLLEKEHCLTSQIEKICQLSEEMRSVRRNVHFEATSIHSLINILKNQRGLTFLPGLARYFLDDEDKSHLLMVEPPVPVRRIGLIAHDHFPRKKLIRKVNEVITQSIKDLKPFANAHTFVVEPELAT